MFIVLFFQLLKIQKFQNKKLSEKEFLKYILCRYNFKSKTFFAFCSVSGVSWIFLNLCSSTHKFYVIYIYQHRNIYICHMIDIHVIDMYNNHIKYIPYILKYLYILCNIYSSCVYWKSLS